MNEKLFKLRLNEHEIVWAEDLGDNKARIDNIPVSLEFGYKDIVSYDPSKKEVIEIVEKKTNTLIFQYEAKMENWKEIVDYFGPKEISTEGLMPGLGSIALPVDYDEDKLQELIDSCPHKLYQFNPDDYGDDE